MFLILETSLTQKVNLQYEFVENDHEHRVPVADYYRIIVNVSLNKRTLIFSQKLHSTMNVYSNVPHG